MSLSNPLTDANQEDDPFANEVAANADADSGINLETHFPDGSPRPERLSEDTTYEEFLEWFEGSAMQGQMESYYSHRPETMNALSENSPGYERNEAGRYVNDKGEALYYFTGPDYDNEKRNGAGLNADADYLTAYDIKAEYEKDRVLQETFGDWGTYWSYINDRQNLIDSGQLLDKWDRSNQLWHDTFMRTRDGRGGPNGQYMADILEAERRRVEDAEVALNAQLAQQYGIEPTMTDTNGNILRWNGSGYSLIERYKEDDKWGNKLAWGAAGMILTAGLSPALIGALGSTAGSAAASAISNSAMQLMQNGNLSLQEAIMAGAIAALGDVVAKQLGGQLTDAVGAAEGGDLKSIVDGYAATGKYSAETIQKMYEIAQDAAQSGSSIDDFMDAFGVIRDIAGEAVFGGNNPEWQPNGPSTQGSGGWVQDPETGEWEYDPSAIQVQYPDYTNPDETDTSGGAVDGGNTDGGGGDPATTDSDGDGIPDSEDEFPNDPTNTPPAGGDGQYEVVQVNDDGTVIVRDKVDGDVWIVRGDYEVGDIITEEVMATDTVGAADPDWKAGTNTDNTTDNTTDSDGDGINDGDDQWPNIPNLPGIDPTVPGNELPDGTTVKDPNSRPDAQDGDRCDHIAEDGTISDGVIKDGVCTLEGGTGTNPNPPVNEGDTCEIGGKTGTIQNGVCVPSEGTTPGEGDACPLPDGTTGTIQGGVCTAGGDNGGGPNEGDECPLPDGSTGTIQGGVCKGNGEGEPCPLPDGTTGTMQGGVCVGTEGTGPNEGDECLLPDGSAGTIQGGVCKGKGDGGDGEGDGGDGNGMLAGIAAGTGGNAPPSWGPLIKGPQFKKFNYQAPKEPTMGSRLFDDIMGSDWMRENKR